MKNVELKILTVEEIEAEPVKWLWEPYVALGKITLIGGDGGVGKSTMLQSIAADLTRGAFWGASDITEPCAVIYQNAEDNYPDTIKPNLERFGADCSRIHVIDESEHPLSLSDPRLEEAIMRTSAKLAILDPLQGYCIGPDIHSVNGMRPLMKHLGEVAERTKCAIVLVSHLNKNGGVKYRNLGSVDIYAAVRSVLTVGKLPLDETMRAIVHTKSNLSPLGKS
jgi:RecA-family ATPase